jgi:hypothetical protein
MAAAQVIVAAKSSSLSVASRGFLRKNAATSHLYDDFADIRERLL